MLSAASKMAWCFVDSLGVISLFLSFLFLMSWEQHVANRYVAVVVRKQRISISIETSCYMKAFSTLSYQSNTIPVHALRSSLYAEGGSCVKRNTAAQAYFFRILILDHPFLIQQSLLPRASQSLFFLAWKHFSCSMS